MLLNITLEKLIEPLCFVLQLERCIRKSLPKKEPQVR